MEKARKEPTPSFLKKNEGEPKAVKAPISDEMRTKAWQAWKEIENVDAEIERRLHEMRIQLKAELGKKANENYQRTQQELGESAKAELTKWLSDVYNGVHGRGDLVVVKATSNDTHPFLARVLTIENPFDSESPKSTASKVESVNLGAIRGEKLYRSSQVSRLEELDNFQDVRQFLQNFSFVEVNFSGTSDKEIDAFCRKLIDRGWLLSAILHAFPENYKPNVQTGDVLNYGSCSHHSGDIVGKQIVLPTGRLAVVSQYSGENKNLFSEYRFWGVLTDLHTEPTWSARHGAWEGPDLDPPNEDEIAFLKGMQIEVLDEETLEDTPPNLITSDESK